MGFLVQVTLSRQATGQAMCAISLSPGREITPAQGEIKHSCILECEVKRALESITMNKASRGDGIPVELFQILKDDAVKVLTQYASKFGKLSSGHSTGKGQFSFQSQRKAMPRMLKLPHNCTHLTR